jgi:hypothetical protein
VIRVLSFLAAHRRAALVLGAVALVFGLGVGIGRRTCHPPVVVQHDVQTQVEYRDRVVTIEKPVDRWRDRVVTITKYTPDGGVGQVIHEETKQGEHKGEVVKTEVDTGRERVKDDLRVAPAPVPPLHAFVEVGPFLDLGRGSVQLTGIAGVTYRLVGPLYVGGELLVPDLLHPTPPVVGLVVGVGL